MDITNTNNLVWEDGMRDLRDIATLCNEIDYLTKQVDTLTAERDEARRIACTYVSGTYKKDVVSIDRTAAMAEAARRGWDCYKEAK